MMKSKILRISLEGICGMEELIKKLQCELGRKLKEDELKFVEWLHEQHTKEVALQTQKI